MKLMVVLPSPKEAYPPEEIELRRKLIHSYASPGTEISVEHVDGGCSFKGDLSMEDLNGIGPAVVRKAREAEARGFDAMMLHCLYDPGISDARKVASIPILGPGRALLYAAALAADRFALIAPSDDLIEGAYGLAREYGVAHMLTPIRGLNIPLPEVRQRHAELEERFLCLARQAIAEGAQMMVPFGLALVPTHLSPSRMEEALGVTVLDGCKIGIRLAESLVATGATRRRPGGKPA